jgi:hypothetical protein
MFEDLDRHSLPRSRNQNAALDRQGAGRPNPLTGTAPRMSRAATRPIQAGVV